MTLSEMGYALTDDDLVIYQAALANAENSRQSLQHLMFAGAPMAEASGFTFTAEDKLAGIVLLYGLARTHEAGAFNPESDTTQLAARAMATDVLTQADEAVAHRAICAASCAGDVPARVMGLWSMGGSKDAAVTLNTPLDMLIAEGAFQGSLRHQGEIIRLARGNMAKRAVTGLDACAVALVTAPFP